MVSFKEFTLFSLYFHSLSKEQYVAIDLCGKIESKAQKINNRRTVLKFCSSSYQLLNYTSFVVEYLLYVSADFHQIHNKRVSQR